MDRGEWVESSCLGSMIVGVTKERKKRVLWTDDAFIPWDAYQYAHEALNKRKNWPGRTSILHCIKLRPHVKREAVKHRIRFAFG